MRTTPRAVTTLLATSVLVAGGLATAAATANASPASPSSRPAGARPTIAHGLYRRVDAKGAASVLVLLRGSAAVNHPDTASGAAAHTSALRSEQAPVLSLLSRSGDARNVHAYKAFDIVSAKVTKKGLDSLASSPDVAQVLPNARFREAAASSTSTSASAAGTPITPPTGACSTNQAKPQLNPEALQTTDTDSDNPGAKTARSLGATGAGVKVAFFAEGIDVNNPDFIRPDGSKVFTDYQDFTGEGTASPTSADEAFIDAASVAAQGRQTYNVQHFGARPTSTPCYIRVEGVAPGASLVDMKVIDATGFGYTSWILQGVDWAVNHDHVNILSQSLGGNPFPDTDNDAFRVADRAALAAGVSVVTSSGDTGITDTIISPGDQPGEISVGATTTYRYYVQDGYGGGQFPGINGWLDDNISSLSSGGEDERGSTVDISAPGDLNWGICTPDPQQYTDCLSFTNQPTSLERSGGTSEAAPIVAGGAALVIQAYRQTHGGATPSPALIKKILVSSARDVDAPGDEQGAGEFDGYRAVLMARSIHTADGAPAAQGNTIATSTGQIDEQGAPGTPVSRPISVTNTGSSSQTVHLATRTLGSWSPFHQQTVTLSGSSPHSVDWQGYSDPYQKVTFTVPSGLDRLDASIAYHGASQSLNARGRLTLIDPNGDLAGYSLPQGIGNYGDTQVRNPVAGKWTGYIYSRPTSGGGSEGKYVFGWRTANYQTSGKVSPSSVTLAPGHSSTVTYSTSTPSTPGDRAASIVVSSAQSGASTIPVVLRSQIPLSTNGTPFKQLLTGGNGRASYTGVGFYYQFQVPSGTPVLNARMTLASNPNNPCYISLVDPHGDQVGYGSNLQTSQSGAVTPERSGVAHALAPQAGTWTLILNFAGVVSGDQLSQPFSVLLNSKQTPVSAPGLPDSSSTTLPAGKPSVVNVRVTNNSGTPEAYFVDPRRSTYATYTLAGGGTLTLPGDGSDFWFVPSDTTSVTQSAESSVPVAFDFAAYTGDPDIESDTSGTTAGGSYSAPEVQPGYWFQSPSEIGPYGAVGAKHVSVTSAMSARTLAFDTQVTSSTGDLWPVATNANAPEPDAVVVQPGSSATIPVTITPRGTAGSVVSGTLFVDDLQLQSAFGELPFADQAAAVPYSYKIGS